MQEVPGTAGRFGNRVKSSIIEFMTGERAPQSETAVCKTSRLSAGLHCSTSGVVRVPHAAIMAFRASRLFSQSRGARKFVPKNEWHSRLPWGVVVAVDDSVVETVVVAVDSTVDVPVVVPVVVTVVSVDAVDVAVVLADDVKDEVAVVAKDEVADVVMLVEAVDDTLVLAEEVALVVTVVLSQLV